MKFYIILLILCGLSSFNITANELNLKPFTSDGCSSFPDGTIEHNELWLHCCRAHDVDYWQGGTKAQRLASDQRLRACVTKVGQPTIAALMLVGVRVGGTPYLPTSYRWGYGWPYPRFYDALSTLELKLIQQELINAKSSQIIPTIID